MTKFIVIASGKGGVGKTTTALNMGAALSGFGKEVIILDANLKSPHIGLHLGSPTFKVTLHDVLKGTNHITDAIYKHPSGIKIIPGSISLNHFDMTNYMSLHEVLPQIPHDNEVVIIDIGNQLDMHAISAIKHADFLIVVTSPDLPAVSDALRTIKFAEHHGVDILGIVANRVRQDGFELAISNIESILEKPVIAVIPEDNAIRESLRIKHPVVYSHPNAPASIAYKKLISDLIGTSYDKTFSNSNNNFITILLKKIGLK